MARIATKNIGGLQLAVDRKLLERPAVLTGKNFLVNVEGPYSAFAYERLHRELHQKSFCQSIRFGKKVYYFTFSETQSDAMWFTLNWPERQESLIFEATTPLAYIGYRITTALVGGKYYFAHRGFGVFEFDEQNNIWTNVTSSFPTNTFFITEAGGRAIAVSDGFASWSAIDNALDFVPSLTTGAGAQALSIIGKPRNDSEYLGLQATSDGFLVFVAQGVLRATLIDSQVVFRFLPIREGEIPLSPLCIARISNSQIILLSVNGLFVTDGRTFKVWQPLMSEYLKDVVLPKMTDAVLGQIQLYYSRVREWFFISYTYTVNVGLFEHAFASYLPRSEWGSFDTVHRGFIELDTQNDGSVIDLAFINQTGKLARFDVQTSNLLLENHTPTNPIDLQSAQFYSDKILDAESYQFDTIVYGSTNSRGSADWLVHETLQTQKIAWPEYPAMYELNGLATSRVDTEPAILGDKISDESGSPAYVNTQSQYMKSEVDVYGFVRQPLLQTSLSCELTLGTFRFTDNQDNDQITNISGISISMVDATTAIFNLQDWLAQPTPDVTYDWLAGTPDIVNDWGYELGNGASYTCTLKGTLDAYAVWNEQIESVTPFKIAGTSQFFSSNVSGMYILVDIKGNGISDYLHLKHAELDGVLAGRL